jgi:hypothetical protein
MPKGDHFWMRSHASNPFAIPLGGDTFRVFFSSRDEKNRSYIASLELEIRGDQFRLGRICDQPVLSPGVLGSFSDSGVSMGCWAKAGLEERLYFLGWNLGVTVPWRNFIEAPIAPILERSAEDPFSLSYPFVMQDGGTWRIWYGSNLIWGNSKDQMQHAIKEATSEDGLVWSGRRLILSPRSDEIGLSRPCLLTHRGRSHMWFSAKHDGGYRIGYASSNDLLSWSRNDCSAGFDRAGEGWDSELVCYPHVFIHDGALYLLYCGNRYGGSGFGLAIYDTEL